MHTQKILPAAIALACVMATSSTHANTLLAADDAADASPSKTLQETKVLADRLFRDTTAVSPTSSLTPAELDNINMMTAEDAIKHEPGLVVRRRFIGDPNGVIGMRGSNMFQGSRSLVFVDGMPLHYHLQTRWSGAPRWSLVSPSEIAYVDVIYGPFSAEYSGNAMGGVVNVDTKTPTEPRVHLETALFAQSYDVLATDETYTGGKFFAAYENAMGPWSVFASFNHLQNDSQPQSNYFSRGARNVPADANIAEVSGLIAGTDSRGRAGMYFGDSGPERSETDLLKLKLGYDAGHWQWRGIIAYEQRDRTSKRSNNYLRDAQGNTVYNRYIRAPGNPDGTVYDTTSWGTSVFQQRTAERESLLLGVGVSTELGADGDWVFDAYYSHFNILKDDEIRTGRHPNDPTFQNANENFAGRLTSFGNTGWQIFDAKIGTEAMPGAENMRLSLGYHFDAYELNLEPFTYNSISGTRGASRGASGGDTHGHALFGQWGWAVSPHWDVSLGLRYESWTAENGYFGDPSKPENRQPKRSEEGFSPKFSLAWLPNEHTSVRYSAARALRFPIIEELYRNENSGVSQRVGDATLKPEDGIHHNLAFERTLNQGYWRINVFSETIEDVIFDFTETTNNTRITTSLPVEEVTTHGADFVWNQRQIMASPFSMRFNLTYTDATITKNKLNPSIVGKAFPRLPRWRSNMMLGYDWNAAIHSSLSVQYASNSFGRLDNSDTAREVYGAQDRYRFVNLRTHWQVNNDLRLAVGIDNLFNERAYVAHPWPSRTGYLEAKWSFTP